MRISTIELHEKGYKKREEEYKYCFDLENWRNSESYKLIKKYCAEDDLIFEIGCLTGHHLILLAQDGYEHLRGIDFVQDAITWGIDNSKDFNIDLECGVLKPSDYSIWYSKIICFDVLEHQPDVEDFLLRVTSYGAKETDFLFLVPKGEEYFDECHVNFYPSERALGNILEKYFKVEECYEVEDGKKLFARCRIL